MAYCHECGEQVAEIDVFCPHCGISLQPVVLPGEDKDLQEHTIAINHSEVADIPGKIDAADDLPATAKQEEILQPVGEPETAPDLFDSAENTSFSEKNIEELDMKTDDFSNPATEENINVKTESVEMPAEFFESKNQTEENNINQPSDLPEAHFDEPFENSAESSQNQETYQPAFEEKTSEPSALPVDDWDSLPPVNENQEYLQPETPAEFSESSPETPLENVEVETPAPSMPFLKDDQDDYFADSSADTGEVTESAGSPADAALEDFVAEKPPEVENETESSMMSYQETEIKELNEVEESPMVSSVSEPQNDSANLADEDKTASDSSIDKPDFDFESEEKPSEISRFDSVRIMEKHEDLLENAAYNNLPSTSAAQAQIDLSKPSPQVSDPAADDTSRESRSHTTPNIGLSDTDGKKSKLKPLDEGTVLNGRYEIVRKIGGGGMGAVYLASDKNLGGVLRAVKEMVQSYIEETQQEKAVNDFKRESMLLTSLEHPAIPTIFDYFYDEKEARFYLVMKYINGGDLSMRLRSAPEGKIEEKSVVEWAIQVADVLDYLHQRQPPIVYRDLKPANIMIDGNTGRIMLIDFGIARWINKEEKGVTAVGTMGYAPPELFSGNVEARSDIYSLGSTMFHLLTGADPQSNPLLIFDFQKNPRPRQINPQLSDQMERILMRAVEYSAEKRFASAAELRRELEKHLDSLKANSVTFGIKETPQAVTLSDQKVFCGFCGQSIVASDLFCAFCGAKQPIAQKGVHGESYASAPVTARLTILGTNDLESPSYTIEKDENLVGRRDPMSNIFPEVDLSKFDPQTKISRRHARIWRDGNKFLVEDLGSSNGTVLMPVINEAFRLVPNKPHILTNGDKLKLGDTTLHFVIG
jgi:serine/threonine-protein kinase